MTPGAHATGGGAHRHRAVEGVGPVPLRAPVGDGPRGLQRRRRRLELPHARPGALARVPLGRGRHRRHLRRAPAAVPGARAVERRRPDPQGADLRAHQLRGQPRRGRQGVLVLPRQHADALVPEVPLQVSAAGVPVRGPGGRERPPRTPRLRVRAARHRDLRRRPLLRRRRRVRQGRAGRHPDVGDGAQPRAGGGDRCTCCRRCGFATRGATARRSRRSPTASPAIAELGEWRFETDAPLLYCENETGPKAAINDHVVARRAARRVERHEVRRAPRAGDPRGRIGRSARAADRRARTRPTSTP